MSEITDYLHKVPIFESLHENDYKPLAQVFTKIEIQSGEEFIKENELGDDLYIIVEGRAEVFMRVFDSEERKISIARLSSFDTVGEFALVRGGSRRTASAFAFTRMTVLKALVIDLEALFEREPHIGMVFYRNLFRTSVDRLAATSIQLRNALF